MPFETFVHPCFKQCLQPSILISNSSGILSRGVSYHINSWRYCNSSSGRTFSNRSSVITLKAFQTWWFKSFPSGTDPLSAKWLVFLSKIFMSRSQLLKFLLPLKIIIGKLFMSCWERFMTTFKFLILNWRFLCLQLRTQIESFQRLTDHRFCLTVFEYVP